MNIDRCGFQSFFAPQAFHSKLEYVASWMNSGNDADTLRKNLVNFGSVTPEIMLPFVYLYMVIGHKSAYRSSFVALAFPNALDHLCTLGINVVR